MRVITRIEIEGVDKTGKDTVADYLDRLSNRRYLLGSRGLLSMIVYSDIYGRNYDYTNEIMDNQNTLIVLLTCDEEDLKIRHQITKEPHIDIKRDMEAFKKHALELQMDGIEVVEFDTSIWTPYNIAKSVLNIVKEANK